MYVRTSCADLLAEDAFKPHHHFFSLSCYGEKKTTKLAMEGRGGHLMEGCGKKALRAPRNGPAMHAYAKR